MTLIPLVCALVAGGQAQTPVATVPFHIAERAIIVDAAVNGRPVSLMFDTGFGASVDVSDNVDIGKQTGTISLQDFVGVFQAPTVKINTLKLGAMAIDTSSLEEAVKSRDDYSASYGTHCDGIMGFQVIKNNITGINYEHSRFDFYPKSMDISKWVPDNKRTFLCRMLPVGDNAVIIAVKTPAGKTMHMALDTGNAFYATTHRDVLERVGLWPSGTDPKFVSQSQVASGAVDSWELMLKNMSVFGATVPEAVWDIIDLPAASSEMDGTVGFGFLHNFNIIVDYGRRRVWLENYTGKFADPVMGEPGIAAAGDHHGNVRVFRVTPNSPAEKAGIKEDDVIISLNGEDLGGLVGYRRMRTLLQGPVGSKVDLAVSSGGVVKRLQLERVGLYNEEPAQSGG